MMFNQKKKKKKKRKKIRRKSNFSPFFMEQNRYFRYNKKGD